MRKDALIPLAALALLIFILGGVYYFFFSGTLSSEGKWLPPENKPPTKQIGVSGDVPADWRGPSENPPTPTTL